MDQLFKFRRPPPPTPPVRGEAGPSLAAPFPVSAGVPAGEAAAAAPAFPTIKNQNSKIKNPEETSPSHPVEERVGERRPSDIQNQKSQIEKPERPPSKILPRPKNEKTQ